MRANAGLGEDRSMTNEPDNLDEVQRRLREIQRRRRSGVRWKISKHTAEQALGALEHATKKSQHTGKPRRRKRHKRLL
jgi:hypothetical protein